MENLRKCRYCDGEIKQTEHYGRNYIGQECFVSTCFCLGCGASVTGFDSSKEKACEKARSYWNRGIYDGK